MQTFLPYPDFEASAAVLDDRRLGKQRVETYQILRTLAGVTQGWRNHPAVRMWRGHSLSLLDYGLVVCREWTRRGGEDTVEDKMLAMRADLSGDDAPAWLGLPALHASHRSNLLRKDPEFYGRHGWTDPIDLPYLWPVPLVTPERV
jgi:hypothetical protein